MSSLTEIFTIIIRVFVCDALPLKEITHTHIALYIYNETEVNFPEGQGFMCKLEVCKIKQCFTSIKNIPTQTGRVYFQKTIS